MCRNSSFNGYKQHFLCRPCRKSIKAQTYSTPACPHCGGPMLCVGFDFKPPRQTNESQWRKVETMLDKGVTFAGGCGCNRTPLVRSLGDAHRL